MITDLKIHETKTYKLVHQKTKKIYLKKKKKKMKESVEEDTVAGVRLGRERQ